MTAAPLPLSNEARRILVETGLRALRQGKRHKRSPGAVMQLIRQERKRLQERAAHEKESGF